MALATADRVRRKSNIMYYTVTPYHKLSKSHIGCGDASMLLAAMVLRFGLVIVVQRWCRAGREQDCLQSIYASSRMT